MSDVEAITADVRTIADDADLDNWSRTALHVAADALESLNKENQALKQSLKARIESLETRMGDIADRIGS